jgi:predicted DNA-binding transcriptional regulator AlpA
MSTSNTSPPARARNFDSLPDSAYVDVRAVADMHDISVPTTWRWSSSGLLPRPEKLGPGTTRWNVGALRRHRAKVAGDAV